MRCIHALFIVAALSATPLAAAAQTTTNSYTYDDLGRLQTVTYPSGAKTGYSYDNADNRTQAQTALNGVLGGGPNHPPICVTQTINITGVPTYVPSISVTGTLSAPCNDPDGDVLTVTSPTSAPTFTLSAGQSYSYNLTVSDGHGGTGTGTMVYHRQ
ncbi:MAG: Ig-like domain-containing protein [Asticcacaulis sp.]|uniref:Ig-like domain-containing protein n=1 Tax=Asticcacaulis sp. TaxID=1872648 RepID=UPI003F7C35D2